MSDDFRGADITAVELLPRYPRVKYLTNTAFIHDVSH